MSKPIRNAVILTAKGGNHSVGNKNVIPVQNVPVMSYPLRAAKHSRHCEAIYVTTEDPYISHIARMEGAEIIDRPAELSQSSSLHKDVIKHAVEAVTLLHPELENVIILLGNTVMVTPGIIDRAFELLDDGSCDSVLTAWKAQDDHPYRAMKCNEDGFMESFLNVEAGSNRQAYPDVFFYDQGIWGFKKECAIEQKGPTPWVWLGERCRMIERPWVTGRDIHTWIDIAASVWYLNSIQPNDFYHYSDLKG
ncbi:NTP transferase domain-containing protein [Cerasicoccus arenae]|uniref:MobA-like NTP transferase domain-containing protein n=1 Tax=Cerasicoccus arenae TaxID=424488 RepID=A0A8J3GCU3_9BACT|nr:NTP transferase domain-containing protein [Cerasicoccus arenae]MBK1857054.1 NTP transferase domain-containing protein [Cerasicoccus arenae]GHB92096.1 hypothetical protein GCM10007047_03880 [Cerasicoccus arenae]